MGRMDGSESASDFEALVLALRPRLFQAFVACRGLDGAADAAAEALAYTFEHWDRIQHMDNPAGYLYRVGQSRTRPRRPLSLPAPETVGVPEVEPALIPALLRLPETQRTAVWLVHACEWRYAEVAEAMDTSVSMVGNHVRPRAGSAAPRLGGGLTCLMWPSSCGATGAPSVSKRTTLDLMRPELPGGHRRHWLALVTIIAGAALIAVAVVAAMNRSDGSRVAAPGHSQPVDAKTETLTFRQRAIGMTMLDGVIADVQNACGTLTSSRRS